MHGSSIDIADFLADALTSSQGQFDASDRSPASGRVRSRPLKPLKVGSCTACRRGKLKCDRGGSHNETPDTCTRCKSHGLKCEYEVHKTGYRVAPTGKHIPGATSTRQSSESMAPYLGSQRDDIDILSLYTQEPRRAAQASEFSPSSRLGGSPLPGEDQRYLPSIPGQQSSQPSDKRSPVGKRSSISTRHKIRAERLDVLPEENPIVRGILSIQEAAALFLFYYGHLHTWNAILDIRLHTLEYVQERSTFLLCVILTQAAAHHGLSLYFRSALAAHTRNLCGRVFSQGYRSPELVAAYMLYSTWLPPDLSVEENNSWSMAGMAIRMAEEIGLGSLEPLPLNAIAADHVEARRRQMEQRFAGRLWLQLLVADRSMSSQMGRSCMMSDATPLAEHVRTFMLEPGSGQPERLLGASFIRRSISHAPPAGKVVSLSPKELCSYRLARLDQWRNEFYRHHDGYGKSCYHHDRMLVLSSNPEEEDPGGGNKQDILTEATEILKIWLDSIVASNSLQYATTLAASLVAYAAATVLEVVRDSQLRLPVEVTRSKIFLVQQLVEDMLQVGAMPGMANVYVAYYGKALKDLLGHDVRTTQEPQEPPSIPSSSQSATNLPFERDFMLDFEDLQKYCFPGWTPATDQFMQSSMPVALDNTSLVNWFSDLDTTATFSDVLQEK